MQQALQPVPIFHGSKYPLAQRSTIQLTGRCKDRHPKSIDDLRQRRAPRLDHRSSHLVGIDHMHAQLGEALRGSAFATTYSAGKTKDPSFTDSHLRP